MSTCWWRPWPHEPLSDHPPRGGRLPRGDAMIWTAVAIVLVLWFAGLLLAWGPLVNLLLVLAAVLLVVQLLNEREAAE